MDLTILTQDIVAFVATNTTLSGVFAPDKEWLFVGQPSQYPAVTLNGITSIDDKQGLYQADINLWIDNTEDSFDSQVMFYDLADKLKEAIHTSETFILQGGWVPRNEPGLNRAQYSCHVYF